MIDEKIIAEADAEADALLDGLVLSLMESLPPEIVACEALDVMTIGNGNASANLRWARQNLQAMRKEARPELSMAIAGFKIAALEIAKEKRNDV